MRSFWVDSSKRVRLPTVPAATLSRTQRWLREAVVQALVARENGACDLQHRGQPGQALAWAGSGLDRSSNQVFVDDDGQQNHADDEQAGEEPNAAQPPAPSNDAASLQSHRLDAHCAEVLAGLPYSRHG